MIRLKEKSNHLEPTTSSSPLPSPLPYLSVSPSLSRSSSQSSIPLLSCSGSDPQESISSSSPVPSPCPSPRESNKLTYSGRDKDVNGYGHHHHHHNGDLSISDVLSEYSVENFRSELPNCDDVEEPYRSKSVVDLDNNVVSNLSYKHVQFMLDDNSKLADEVRSLKAKLNVLSGDHVSLGYKYQQLEAKCQAKNAELVELEGKVSALTVQLKSESEAKIEAQAKLSLAESTIESLNRQMGVMAKSDFNSRLRENYEAMISKLRNQHETEMIVLKGENEGLKGEMESKQGEIDSLKAQLLEKEKALSNIETDKLSNISELKQKYEEILRETCNKVEYESILRRKNDEIESLHREIQQLKNNTSNNSSQSFQDSPKCVKLSQNESDYVKNLKEEFEKCIANLHTRRTQITALQTQLTASKRENMELREQLREAERRIYENTEFLKTTHQPWVKEIEARYAAQFDKDLAEAIRVMDKTQREEMERSFHQRLERYVDQLIQYLESLSDLDCPDDHEPDRFDNIFAPLRKLWISINCNLEEKFNELEMKQQSMLEAKENLEKALIVSKSFDNSAPQSSVINQELEKIKQEGIQMKAKLDKYKRHYHRLIEKHEREIDKLKNHYVKIVAEREKEYRVREERLIEELSDNSITMCRRLSSYFNNATKDDR